MIVIKQFMSDIYDAQELPYSLQELANDERRRRRRNQEVQQQVVVLDSPRQDGVEGVQGEGRVVSLLG